MHRIRTPVILLLIVWAAFPASLSAQLPVAYRQDFSLVPKEWVWTEYDSPRLTRAVRDGRLQIVHREHGLEWTSGHFQFDPTDAYDLEMSLTVDSGHAASWAGFTFRGVNTQYYFTVNSLAQTYWIGTFYDGVWNTLNAFTGTTYDVPSSAIAPPGKENRFTISRRGDSISLVINGVSVESLSITEGLKGFELLSGVHVVTSGPITCSVDYVELRQEQQPISVAEGMPSNLVSERLPPTVNSPLSDRTPVISADGRSIYFTRYVDGIGDDIWFSTMDSAGNWMAARSIGAPINNAAPNGTFSVTPDNNTLLLLHRYNADGTWRSEGLSTSNRNGTVWTVPEDVVIENFYNTGSSLEFCLSPDRSVLISAIRREPSRGLNDLYVSFRREDGSFSEPLNMGSDLNTWGWETAPFLAADGRTLYFGSDGHPGYGWSDLFVSHRLDSTWTRWSKPQNLGPAINTPRWEAYFVIPASGAYAYLVRSEGGGQDDIYRVELPPAIRPDPVVLIRGRVLHGVTGEPLAATITYDDLESGRRVGDGISDPVTGRFAIVLGAGGRYAFNAERTGFFPLAENLDLSARNEYGELERDLILWPIEPGTTIRLNNIFFDVDRSTLRPESRVELERVRLLLQAQPALTLTIAGHTDSDADDAHNQRLSRDRAEAVRSWLIDAGIAPERLAARGYGESKPVATNETEEGRQRNRRVEIVIDDVE